MKPAKAYGKVTLESKELRCYSAKRGDNSSHDRGHCIKRNEGKQVQLDRDELVINASNRVAINTAQLDVAATSGAAFTMPDLQASAKLAAPTIEAGASLKVQGKEMHQHHHSGVNFGTDESGLPV